jgi:hypothetical protein
LKELFKAVISGLIGSLVVLFGAIFSELSGLGWPTGVFDIIGPVNS